MTIFLNIVNLLACFTFIVEDYYSGCNDSAFVSPDCETNRSVYNALEDLEISFSVIFLLEFVYIFAVTKPKWHFFVKKDTYIDLLTIVPPMVNLILQNNIKIGFLRMLRMFKVMRIARIFKVLKMANQSQNEA